MSKTALLNILKSLGAFLATVIPLLQFAYQWFPEQISALFVNKDLIFFTTTITFLMSVFFIFIGLSRFSIMVPTLTMRTDPNNGERYRVKSFVPLRVIAMWFVPIIFICAIGFMLVGAQSHANVSEWQQILQSGFYIITFSFAVFVLTIFSYDVADRKNREDQKKDRYRRAINLAKENDAFEILPKINFFFEKENTQDGLYITEVYIMGEKYRIITDREAETLKAVYKVDDGEKEQ